eukprot:2020891-Alexandrium_andersonii.AAC.1
MPFDPWEHLGIRALEPLGSLSTDSPRYTAASPTHACVVVQTMPSDTTAGHNQRNLESLLSQPLLLIDRMTIFRKASLPSCLRASVGCS